MVAENEPWRDAPATTSSLHKTQVNIDPAEAVAREPVHVGEVQRLIVSPCQLGLATRL